jgi:hypothetical protein
MWHTSVVRLRAAVNSPGPHSHTSATVGPPSHRLTVDSSWLLLLVGFGCGAGSFIAAA